MSNVLRYFNGFGIEPKNNCLSAGTDYFIPNIDSTNEEVVKRAESAFFLDPVNPSAPHSYNCTRDQADELKVMFSEALSTTLNDSDKVTDLITRHWHNILHLYLALQSYDLETIRSNNGNVDGFFIEDVYYFVENYLIFDNNGTPGLDVKPMDHLFINSGIKVALDPGTCGLYDNKSGMGTRGWSKRACLVDEDYAGYVHLSASYTMWTHKAKPSKIYCGDKFIQMIVFEVRHNQMQSISESEYNEIMKDSKRGEAAWGSSDVKH